MSFIQQVEFRVGILYNQALKNYMAFYCVRSLKETFKDIFAINFTYMVNQTWFFENQMQVCLGI